MKRLKCFVLFVFRFSFLLFIFYFLICTIAIPLAMLFYLVYFTHWEVNELWGYQYKAFRHRIFKKTHIIAHLAYHLLLLHDNFLKRSKCVPRNHHVKLHNVVCLRFGRHKTLGGMFIVDVCILWSSRFAC